MFYVDRCALACERTNSAVCGSTGKTYSDLCDLKESACRNPAHNLQLKNYGPCAGSVL